LMFVFLLTIIQIETQEKKKERKKEEIRSGRNHSTKKSELSFQTAISYCFGFRSGVFVG